MSPKEKFKMIYSHLRRMVNRPFCDQASWLTVYETRKDGQPYNRAASLAVQANIRYLGR